MDLNAHFLRIFHNKIMGIYPAFKEPLVTNCEQLRDYTFPEESGPYRILSTVVKRYNKKHRPKKKRKRYKTIDPFTRDFGDQLESGNFIIVPATPVTRALYEK